VLVLAVLLGLRHAADPDHLVAVSTLVATDVDPPARRAATLGLAWGLGHAASLIAFGLPVVLFGPYLPQPLQAVAEALAGVLIGLLAVRLLWHWRRERFHVHAHAHHGAVHRHLHDHGPEVSGPGHGHEHVPARSPTQAGAIGLVHGIGGSATVGVLLLASAPDRARATTALIVFAVSTAVAMTVLSLVFGYALGRAPTRRGLQAAIPALGAVSFVFGVVYAYGAIGAAQ
jgi:ABC-type nickel/cobalt efflux system permease component RcnA